MLRNVSRINKNVARAASNRKAVICQPVMRSYSSQGGESGVGSGRGAIFAGGALLTGLGLYFFNNLNNYEGTRNQAVAKIEEKLPVDSGSRDYQKVYNAIVDVLENENYDDGTFAPVLLRLAWHASGTFSKHDKANPGGSNKATMRFKAEAEDGANAGLEVGRGECKAGHSTRLNRNRPPQQQSKATVSMDFIWRSLDTRWCSWTARDGWSKGKII